MKIILSRKGVDSSSGGFASPLFADGRMLSIPIPDQRAGVRYRDVASNIPETRLAKLVQDLSKGALRGAAKVHLDPDLTKQALPRQPGWQALFGQHGAAQSHLQSHGVGAGDIFLFFGWFRQVELYRRRWRYITGAPDQHIIFGWMQVEAVDTAVAIRQSDKLRWAHYHPHCLADFTGNNIIYRARDRLKLPRCKMAGSGVFHHYDERLCLTEKDQSRSCWKVPEWMYPVGKKSALSYHSDVSRWHKAKEGVTLKSVARGQEFVLDLDHYPEAVPWLRNLLAIAR